MRGIQNQKNHEKINFRRHTPDIQNNSLRYLPTIFLRRRRFADGAYDGQLFFAYRRQHQHLQVVESKAGNGKK